MPWLFFFVSLIGAWLTYNAYQPIYAGARRAAFSFFAGWLTTELALHHIAWQAVMTLVFLRAGALHAWPGRLEKCSGACSARGRNTAGCRPRRTTRRSDRST